MNVFPEKSKLLSIFFVLLCAAMALSGCNKKLEISNFDAEAWKADKMACLNKRQSLGNNLLEAKSELLELTQQDIIDLLGRPEMQELYTRGQKFYIYHLTPGSRCESVNSNANKPRLLYIRFSALNQVSEVFVK